MRVKRLVATLLVGVLALAAVACGSSSKSSKLQNTDDTFVVGFDQNFPPFGYVDDNGEYTGFDIELAQEVAKRLDMECVLQPIDWDAKDLELEAGTIDCIWNGFTMNGREDSYTWSDPYMNNSQVFVVREDSGINSEEDLAGKIVDVQKESSAETALNEDDMASLTYTHCH